MEGTHGGVEPQSLLCWIQQLCRMLLPSHHHLWPHLGSYSDSKVFCFLWYTYFFLKLGNNPNISSTNEALQCSKSEMSAHPCCQAPIWSVFQLVLQLRNQSTSFSCDCWKLPFKTTDEKEEEEATAIKAVEDETSMDAAVEAVSSKKCKEDEQRPALKAFSLLLYWLWQEISWTHQRIDRHVRLVSSLRINRKLRPFSSFFSPMDMEHKCQELKECSIEPVAAPENVGKESG